MIGDVLYLAHRIPYPPNKGDKVRSYHMLRFLCSRYRVHLGTFVDAADDWRHVPTLRDMCAETYFAPLSPLAARVKSLAGLARGEPLSLAYYRDAGLKGWVDDLLTNHPVTRAVVFSAAMAQYVEAASRLRCVVDFVDVDSEKWRQYAQSRSWPMGVLYRREAQRLLAYERRVAAGAAASVFVSPAEAAQFRRLAPECAQAVSWVRNGVDFDYFSPARSLPDPYRTQGPVATFTGAMDYWPNVDAVDWFAREILPRVRSHRPDLQFWIVGANPAATVRRLERLPGVRVTGTVPDVRPYLAHATVSVAPMRLGRGLQNKVLEAMAMARPVVASPQAVTGVDVADGRDVLVAVDAPSFAAAVCRLLADPGRAGEMGMAARGRVLRDYDWERNLQGIDTLVRGDGGAPRETSTPMQRAAS